MLTGSMRDRDAQYLKQVTDDQLRAEYQRRFGMRARPIAAAFSDDQLRAECERRGIVAQSATVGALKAEMHGRAQAAEGWATASARCVELEKERDQWKRLAKLAEADLEFTKGHLEEEMCRVAKLQQRALELGHGIAAMPRHLGGDRGHWVDELDLLAADV
jgi:hypothetical protein